MTVENSIREPSTVLSSVHGRIVDVDAHEWIPTPYWEQEFGPAAGGIVSMLERMPREGPFLNYLNHVVDDKEIDPDTIWKLKGSGAPSAADLARRPAVLDAMGIDRQLIFPSGPGLFSMILATSPPERAMAKILTPELVAEAISSGLTGEAAAGAAQALMTAYNDWCIRLAATSKRLRPVGVLDSSSIDRALSEAQRLIDGGVRAVMIPSDCPPGGKSPADPELATFWRFFEDNNLPILLHVAGEFNFMATNVWGEVPLFDITLNDIAEISTDPYTLSVAHFGAQNFLTTLILGGVFERHPGLRFGILELEAGWVGPMAESLEMWIQQFHRRLSVVLHHSPSEYLSRNVRVSPFFWEPVDKYIERYGLEDVYAFSSDYPHVEGGPETANLFADRIGPLGPEVVEKFFVQNGELLIPA